MKTAAARAIAWSAVALLALGALRFTPPLSERRPAVLLDGASRVSDRRERVDSLARGRTFGGRKRPQTLELLGEQPLLTQQPYAHLLELAYVARCVHIGERQINKRRERFRAAHG